MLQVTSFSTGEQAGHMAFSYWFHPPDSSDFEQPYTCGFWPALWSARLPQLCPQQPAEALAADSWAEGGMAVSPSSKTTAAGQQSESAQLRLWSNSSHAIRLKISRRCGGWLAECGRRRHHRHLLQKPWRRGG